MANWKTLTLKDVLIEIGNGKIVLPVIQRELVWEIGKITAIFETILKGESFGGIMTVIDPARRPPLFEFRNFIRHFHQGQVVHSKKIQKLEHEITYVIDGQQRLSAFYIGIMGEYNDKCLYFDLFGESDHNNFNFTFSRDESKLPSQLDNHDGTKKIKTQWYKLADIYVKFEDGGYDHQSFFDEFASELDENMLEENKKIMRDNLYKIQVAFFSSPVIGLCGVPVNRNIDATQNRLNIVRLFQKLNQAGTILSGIELMRSVLKAYSSKNELFLNHIKEKYADIGFDQDEIVKLIFLLQDNHRKDIIEIDQSDSDFIEKMGERIKNCIEGTRSFLKHAGLYEYIKVSRPSLIPLTFVAYHLFHLEIDDPSIYFDNYETGNVDFLPVREWLIISLLNHVFQRGNGWDPIITGRKKILDVMIKNKNKKFPVELLYDIYRDHSLHKFDNKINCTWEWINWYERKLVVYLIYGKPSNFRQNDIDHIHPKSILEANGVEWNKINLLGNFQYLYYPDNRSKQAVEFGDWLNELFKESSHKLNDYLDLHCIPADSRLWRTDKYEEFLEARRLLICSKLKKQI